MWHGQHPKGVLDGQHQGQGHPPFLGGSSAAFLLQEARSTSSVSSASCPTSCSHTLCNLMAVFQQVALDLPPWTVFSCTDIYLLHRKLSDFGRQERKRLVVRGLGSAVPGVLCRAAKTESEQLNCLLQFPKWVQTDVTDLTDISDVPNKNKAPKYQEHVLDKCRVHQAPVALTLPSKEAEMEEETTPPSLSRTIKSPLPEVALWFLCLKSQSLTRLPYLLHYLFIFKCFFCFIPEVFAHLTLLGV